MRVFVLFNNIFDASSNASEESQKFHKSKNTICFHDQISIQSLFIDLLYQKNLRYIYFMIWFFFIRKLSPKANPLAAIWETAP